MWIPAWDPQIKVFVPSGLPPHSNDSCYSIWGWLQLKWSFRMLFFLFFSYRVGEIMRCLWMYNDLCMFVNCIIIYANTCYIWMIHITFSLNTYMWGSICREKNICFFSSLSSKTDPTNQGPSRSLSFVTVLCGRVRGKTWIFDAILVVGWDHLEGPLAIGPARDVETTGNQKIGDRLNKATFFTGRNAF